jgi:hypothetical protein
MKEADNDDTDTWILLAALTANVTRYLTKEKNPNEEAGTKRDERTRDDDQRGEVAKAKCV